MKKKIYLAGPLFNEAEVNQRRTEGIILRETFGDKIDLYNPIDQPMNDNKDGNLPTCREIFENDYEKVKDCDIFICDLTNEDAGTMIELGIAMQLGKEIYAVNSDIRLASSNKYNLPPYGVNHFMLGLVEKHGYLFTSFNNLVKCLKV